MKDVLKALVFGGLFAIPFLTLYVENDYFFPFITGKNFWFRIIVEITFASWILLAMSDRDYRPKWSWILGSFGALLVVMFFANLFGEYPLKSFWSNFERMDGYVTLVHVFLYMVTLGSTLTTPKLWNYFMHTSLVVAFFVALYGLGQFAGLVEGREAAGGRIDSRLGNASYLAIYMLFHAFFAFWLFVESRVTMYRVVYALLGATYIYALVLTATRGTFIGLAVGVFVMAAYIALFGSRFKEFRKYAIGLFIVLLVAGGGLFIARDAAVVQDFKPLSRIANISLGELEVRFTIWGMAWEGVKERPLLGWGQGNFNYVFNEQYDSSLYAQEQWFDRVHNIFFDWLIAGGFLGFVAYFGILAAILYYLFWQPLFGKEEPAFDVLERGVLLGLIAGYFTHNLVVFDNIVSYIFYGTVLALIHSRVSKEIPKIQNWKIDDRLVSQFAAPIVVLVVGTTVYFTNVPGMQAAGDIIDAFRGQTPEVRLEQFNEALSRGSFADQEIVEQLAQQAMSIGANPNVPVDVRNQFAQRAENETLRMIEEKPGDARLHVFLGSYYRAIGEVDKAKEQAAIARVLSPAKQSIILQQGVLEIQTGNPGGASEFFREAYELDDTNAEAREIYAASLFTIGESEAGRALIQSEADLRRFALSDYAVSSVSDAGDNNFLAELYEVRVAENPQNSQNWASLAYVYFQLNENDRSIEVLEQSKETIPSFAPKAQCFIDNISVGINPGEGC